MLLRTLMKKIAASPAHSTKPFTVIVEGNIGCGKTTFLNHFRQFDNVCVLNEPIEMWRDVSGYNLLSLMYKDPKKWAFSLQSYIQLSMMQQHQLKTPQPVKMMERSIYSARHCFVEKLVRDGLMEKASGHVIDEWFKWICANTNVGVDLIVYLKSSPEVVYERIKRRDRKEEKDMSFDYVQDMHDIHENWLSDVKKLPAPLIILNADLEQNDLTDQFEKIRLDIAI